MEDDEDPAAALGFTGGLHAVRTENTGSTDEVTAELMTSAGAETAFRLEAAHMSSAVDVDLASGVVSSQTSGRPPNKAAAELRVGEVLRRTLNAHGDEWAGVEPGEDHRGEDVVLVDGVDPPRRQPIQVTMVDGKKWAAAVSGTAWSSSTVDDLADQMLDSIQRHSQMVTSGVILALDAMNGDAHGLLSVVDNFRQRHAEVAAALGWRAIWLVGINPAHTLRLSP